MTWVPWLLSGLSLLVAVISLLRVVVVAGRDKSLEVQADILGLRERCTLIEMKLGVFWRLVEENLSGMLKKPIHQVMDTLLDKLKDHTLTLPEARHLRALLDDAYLEGHSTEAQNRIVAILVIAAVDSLIHELEFRNES